MSTTQTVNLEKGQKVDLTKTNPGLKVLGLGLFWDANSGNGDTFDLDAYALCLNAQGKMITPSDESVLYFNNLKMYNGALSHSGDELTGAASGDDETIIATLGNLPQEVDQIMLCANIFQADTKKQNFGQVRNAGIHAYDFDTKAELARFDLSEDYSGADNVIFARLYRHNGEWKFEAKGEGFKGSINDAITKFS